MGFSNNIKLDELSQIHKTETEKLDNDIDSDNDKIISNNLGWTFLRSNWDEGDIWESLIINKDGNSQKWYVEDMDEQIPDKFPSLVVPERWPLVGWK